MKFPKLTMLFTMLCTTIALAEEGSEQLSTGEEIEELVVTVRATLKTDHLANLSATVLDEETVRQSNALHPNETFDQVPGVWVSRGSGQEHLTAIRSGVLTGAGACGAYRLLENGIPVRPASFCNVNGLFEVNTEQASAVEVIRGPVSSRYGSNALHGAINVVTLQDQKSNIEAQFGSYGLAQARVNLSNEDLGLTAHTTRSSGWRDETGFSQTKLNAQVRQEIGPWQGLQTVALTDLSQETGGYVLGMDAYKDDDIRFTNPNPEAYRNATSFRYGGHFRNGSLVVAPYVRYSEMDFLMHFLPGQPIEENSQQSAGVLSQLTCDFKRLSVSMGMQAEYVNAELRETQDNPTLGSAFLVETRPQGTHYDFEVGAVHIGAFHDARYRVADNLALKYRVRMESAKYRYDNRHLEGQTRDDGSDCGFGGCLYTRPPDRDDTFLNYAMQVGFESEMTSNWMIYGMLGTGFRPPQIAELYRLQSGQETAEIDSERLEGFEVGLTRDVAGNLLQLAYYSERSRNLIIRDAEGFNQSAGAVDSQGIEMQLSYALTPRQYLNANWTSASHKYNFTQNLARREVITRGNDVDTAPRQMGSLSWQFNVIDQATFGFKAVRIGSYYLDAANTTKYPGHIVLNSFLRWRLNDVWEIRGNVQNLLDVKYADRADLSFGNVRYFPAMPRNVQLGLRLSL